MTQPAGDRQPTLLPPPPQAARRMITPSRARQAMSAGALARHRFLVQFAKWLLPAAALSLLGLMVLWPELDRSEDRGRLAFRRVTQASPETARVINPRYQGLDEAGRPFNVTASVAAQRATGALVDLEQPRADLLMGENAWVLLEAEKGVHDRETNSIDLEGNVTLWHDNGTTMRTESAAIDMKGGNAHGEKPVAAQGPFGTLTSEGFDLLDRGRVVVFTGKARAVLEGNSSP